MKNTINTVNFVPGGIYHNRNGQDYYILDYSKTQDKVILLNPNNSFTPFIGAWGISENCWCQGKYFKYLDDVYNWMNGGRELYLVEVYEDKKLQKSLFSATFYSLHSALDYMEVYDYCQMFNIGSNKVLATKTGDKGIIQKF